MSLASPSQPGISWVLLILSASVCTGSSCGGICCQLCGFCSLNPAPCNSCRSSALPGPFALALRRRTMKKTPASAARPMTPSATPTPMPAFAPVLKPSSSSSLDLLSPLCFALSSVGFVSWLLEDLLACVDEVAGSELVLVDSCARPMVVWLRSLREMENFSLLMPRLSSSLFRMLNQQSFAEVWKLIWTSADPSPEGASSIRSSAVLYQHMALRPCAFHRHGANVSGHSL